MDTKVDTKDGHKVDTKMDLTDVKEPKVGIWGGGGLGSGEVWGGRGLGGVLFGEVCHLGRFAKCDVSLSFKFSPS